MRKRKLLIVLPLVCIVALVCVLLLQGGPPVLTDDAYVHIIVWGSGRLLAECLLVRGSPLIPFDLARGMQVLPPEYLPVVTVTKAEMREILAILSPKMKKGRQKAPIEEAWEGGMVEYVTAGGRWEMSLYAPTQATLDLLRKVQNCLLPEERYAMDGVISNIWLMRKYRRAAQPVTRPRV